MSSRWSVPPRTRNFKHCSRYPKASERDIKEKSFLINLESSNPFDTVIPGKNLALDEVFNLAVTSDILLQQVKQSLASHGLIMIPEVLNHILCIDGFPQLWFILPNKAIH